MNYSYISIMIDKVNYYLNIINNNPQLNQEYKNQIEEKLKEIKQNQIILP